MTFSIPASASFSSAIYHVCLLPTGEMVCRVTARRIIAIVTNTLAFWNRTISKFVGFTMCKDVLTLPSKIAIPSIEQASCPGPTRFRTAAYIDSCPKTPRCLCNTDTPGMAYCEAHRLTHDTVGACVIPSRNRSGQATATFTKLGEILYNIHANASSQVLDEPGMLLASPGHSIPNYTTLGATNGRA